MKIEGQQNELQNLVKDGQDREQDEPEKDRERHEDDPDTERDHLLVHQVQTEHGGADLDGGEHGAAYNELEAVPRKRGGEKCGSWRGPARPKT